MTEPLEYDATKGPLEILSILSVPTVATIRMRVTSSGSARSLDGRLPHVFYATGLGMAPRAVVAQGPSYDDPLAYRFDAGSTVAFPYLGAVYIVGGQGRAIITVYSRRSEEKTCPASPLPPQRWRLTHATAAAAVAPIEFIPPMGSDTLEFAGPSASVELRYGPGGVETYSVTNQDVLSIAGVTSVLYTPSAPGQTAIKGWL